MSLRDILVGARWAGLSSRETADLGLFVYSRLHAKKPMHEAHDLYLHDFMHCAANTWLADWINALQLVTRNTGVPNNLAGK